MSEKPNSIQYKKPQAPVCLFANWRVKEHDPEYVLKKVLTTITQFDRRDRTSNRVEDKNVAGKYIIYGANKNSGPTLAQYLDAFGCPDITNVDNEPQLFGILRAVNVRCLILWYGTEQNHSAEVLRRINEARHIPRMPVLVVCASDVLRRQFEKKHRDLYFDLSINMPASRLVFAEQIERLMQFYRDQDSSRMALETLRKLVHDVEGHRPYKVSIEALKELSNQILSSEDKISWLQIETAILHLRTGRIPQAIQLSTALVQKYPTNVLCSLLNAQALKEQDGTVAAVKWLLNHVAKFILSQDQAHQIGMLLAKWRNSAGLRVFLNHWVRLKSLRKDHHLAHLIACYYDTIGDLAKAKQFLKVAVASNPFRFEYLAALADNYLQSKDFRSSEKHWECARKLPFTDPLRCDLGLIRCWYGQRRVRHADGKLNQLLKSFPTHPELLEALEVFVNSRVA